VHIFAQGVVLTFSEKETGIRVVLKDGFYIDMEELQKSQKGKFKLFQMLGKEFFEASDDAQAVSFSTFLTYLSEKAKLPKATPKYKERARLVLCACVEGFAHWVDGTIATERWGEFNHFQLRRVPAPCDTGRNRRIRGGMESLIGKEASDARSLRRPGQLLQGARIVEKLTQGPSLPLVSEGSCSIQGTRAEHFNMFQYWWAIRRSLARHRSLTLGLDATDGGLAKVMTMIASNNDNDEAMWMPPHDVRERERGAGEIIF